MATKLPPAEAHVEIDDVISKFGSSAFSTKDFIVAFEKHYSKKWKEIVGQYGIGGKNSGNRYSSSGFIGRQLDFRSSNGKLDKLPRQKSPPGWGNPWILNWKPVAAVAAHNMYPDEAGSGERHLEGGKKKVFVNKYERDEKARKKCIDHYGCKCSVCEMTFESKYGQHGAGFVHVHHLEPLHISAKQHEVDPIKDLRPVCPNCHAMIHYGDELLSIEATRAFMRSARGQTSR